MKHYMCIYIIQNIINNKIYIGQTNNLQQRWSDHKKPSLWKRNKSHLYSAMKKYGVENFIISKLAEFTSNDKAETLSWANYIEEFLIGFLNARNKHIGYNIMNGGDNRQMSQETKNKIRKSNIGKKHTKETKIKISLAASTRPGR